MVKDKLAPFRINYGNLLLFIYSISINILFTENTQLFSYFIIGTFIIIIFLKIYFNKEITNTLKINNVLISFGCFILLGLLSIFWSVAKYQTLNKVSSLILIFIAILFLYNLVISKTIKTEYFLYGIIASVWINFLMLILNKTGIISEHIIFFDSRFIGTKTNANEIGYVFVYALFSILFLVTKRKRGFSLFLFITLLLVIYLSVLTGSKKTLIGLVFLLIGYQFYRIRTYWGIIRISIFLFGMFLIIQNLTTIIDYLDSPYLNKTYARFERALLEFNNANVKGSTSERLDLIKLALTKIKEKPLLGHGLNSFTSYSKIYTHSNYLEILTSLGVVGMIIFYSMHAFTFFKGYLYTRKNIKMRWLFCLFIFIILLIDFTAVNYYNKLYYSMLVILPLLKFNEGNLN